MKITIHSLLFAACIAQACLFFSCTKGASAQAGEESTFSRAHNQTVRAAALSGAIPEPACEDQGEACREAWFAYGDATGDYGVIDAAE